MLYWIVPAMFPQFLITLNEELEEIPVTVRVGQAVNTVAQAGTRHGISGVSSDSVKNTVGIGQLTNQLYSSKLINHQFELQQQNEQSWEPTSSSLIRAC